MLFLKKFLVKLVINKLTKIFIILLAMLLLNSMLVQAQIKPPLKQKWNMVSRKLEFARELQASFRDETTIETLNSAATKLDHARDLMTARRPLLANQLINEAENLINQAMRVLLKEPLRLRRENLDQKIQIANDLVRKSNIYEAIDLLDKGIENKTIAEQSFKENEFQKAIRHFRKAEFQIQKAIDLATNRDQSTATRANDEAQQFDQLKNQSNPTIARSTNPEVQKNYRLAIKLSEQANKARTDGDYRKAIDLYHQATRLLLRTRDLAEGKIDRSATRGYEEVAALDELIETIQQRVIPFEDDERIQFFMSHIEQLQEDAHQALEAQDCRLALLNTQFARDLIERVQKKLRGDDDEMAGLIDQELKQLEVDLNDIKVRLIAQGSNEEANILLAYARFARAKAQELLDQRNYRFARESILLANRFAFAADRLIRAQSVETVAAETILNKIQSAEKNMASIRSKISATTGAGAQAYFEQSQKMLDLARENFNNNYRYAANACIEASQSAFEKLRQLLKLTDESIE